MRLPRMQVEEQLNDRIGGLFTAAGRYAVSRAERGHSDVEGVWLPKRPTTPEVTDANDQLFEFAVDGDTMTWTGVDSGSLEWSRAGMP